MRWGWQTILHAVGLVGRETGVALVSKQNPDPAVFERAFNDVQRLRREAQEESGEKLADFMYSFVRRIFDLANEYRGGPTAP